MNHVAELPSGLLRVMLRGEADPFVSSLMNIFGHFMSLLDTDDRK